MALRKIHRGYYIYWKDEKGQHTRSLKTRDEAAARAMHDEWLRMVDERRRMLGRFWLDESEQGTQPPPAVPAPAQHPAGEHRRGGIAIADMWDVAITRRPLSRTHKIHWMRFVRTVGVKYADQVTPQVALAYLERTYPEGNGKTYNNARSAINTIFRCCLVEAKLDASPFAAIINRRVTNIEHHRNLTDAEFDRAFAAAPEHFRLLMMLSRWTCQRLETCARMTPAMFDFERLVFLIDPGKTRRFRKWVCVPIMPPLADFIRPVLAQCPDRDSPILSRYTRRRCSDLSCDFVRLLRSLGINDTDAGKASFHSIRGTAITWYKEQGIAGDDFRYITGHTSDAVEDIYARPVARLSKIAKSAADNPRFSM